MADQTDEPMDLTDLPLLSRSNVLTEAQDAAAVTSATPFAGRKSKAQKQREYRQRIAASRTPAQAIAARKSDAERQRNCRLRNSALVIGLNDVQTGTQRQLTHQQHQTSAAEPAQQAQSTWTTKWASSIMRFQTTFLDNDFGYACSVCDRLWFKNDLKPTTAAQMEVISEWFVKENRRLRREEFKMVCTTCKRTLNKKSMPPLAKVNGFSYPDQPPGLPPLDPISERLISPCLPFMQVRRLRHDFSYGIVGQVINVPVDGQEMVRCLPRQLNEDDVVNVNIKRNLAYKSVYISGYMSKSTISAWLAVLQNSPLYRLFEINVDLSRLYLTVPFLDDIQDDPANRIENISAEDTPESEILASRQHTMMWNEEAPQATPLNIIYDRHAEELSFPSIYFGEPRRFGTGVSVTPDMIAASEIRRRDRRGATPQKILYVAMKLLRLRMEDGMYSTENLAFMKTVPNSVQYWASRKRDLFALIRQLGKPTVFLTISANEIRWTKLLTILLKLSKKYPGKIAEDLNTSERCTLVSDDPVTCCIYFYKLVGSLLKILKSKQSYNPFDTYFVKDYFLRIGFQHGGSPQAHILLWLNDDPREAVSENMPRTIDLVEKLSSVARDDVPNNSIYANQIHQHTFTCTKQGQTTCRFGIPYWPMPTTRVLVPIPQSDGRQQTLQQKAKELRISLGERRYASIDEFLNANGLTFVSYLDVVRSTLRRPTLVFRRNFDELMTNTFNPYLAGEVNSNIDIQFILDEHSCAEYIVEYVTKSARGMGNLRRELTTMMQEHPDRDYTGQLKDLSIKLLNAVEMSAQEAAWYLLRQPMSETSRQVVYIPTVWPTERQRCRKRRQQMDREGIDADSSDVWTKNIIQRYEERPASLEQVYLAEFASWYANANDFVDEEDVVHVDDDEDVDEEARTSRAPKEYRRRLLGRIIRYRRYDIDDTVNYKREMVLLYVQFRNEMSEIVDQNKFLQVFDDNEDTIIERRSLFETNLNIENVAKELEEMMILHSDLQEEEEEESRAAFDQRLFQETPSHSTCQQIKIEIEEVVEVKLEDLHHSVDIKDEIVLQEYQPDVECKAETSGKPFKCDVCDYKCSHSGALQRHVKTHTGDKQFTCGICEYKCSRKDRLKIHLKTHTDSKAFKCEICDFTCARVEKLNLHFLRTHASKKQFMCDVCGYKCKTNSILKRHLKIHTVEKPFRCEFCEFKCSQEGRLNIHVRTHTGEKPFTCETCDYKCASKGDFKRHLRTHTGEKPYACVICDFTSARQNDLNKHVRTHTGDKPFTCELCGYKYTTNAYLKRHLRTHSGEKPFQCEFCDYKCAEQGRLNIHVRSHTGDKPFKCEHCDYKGACKGDLKRHSRTHTGEKPFACIICEFKSARRDDLNKHIRTHTGEKPFTCDTCDFRSSRKENLKYHLKTHTGEK